MYSCHAWPQRGGVVMDIQALGVAGRISPANSWGGEGQGRQSRGGREGGGRELR